MTKIIAEVGSNFKTIEDCIDSISTAYACGANAVKFQAYNYQALYGYNPSPFKPDMPGTLPTAWLPRLAQKAKTIGIEFMCSAFSPELLKEADPYVKTHKVASAELTHKRLLQAINATGKPVILSTGASGLADIRQALGELSACEVTLLYCVAAYPTRFVNFERLDELQCKFGPKYAYGFSDHTTDVACIPCEAVRHGATVIEKHVNFVGAVSPDSPHSLTTDEFKIMVKSLRGEPMPMNDNSEHDMYVKHNRRLVAIADIRIGDPFKEGVNFGIFRSLHPETSALSPWVIDQVVGMISKKEIKAGFGIEPSAVF